MATETGFPPLGNVRRLLYMYGTVTQMELKNFLEFNSVDSDLHKREIKASWAAAAKHFEELRRTETGMPDTIATRPLSEENTRRAEGLRRDPLFDHTFSDCPYSFEEVELDKLVACQRTVHLEYISQLISEYERRGRDLLDYCLTPGRDTTPVNVGRTAPNAFTASSDNPGLRFLGAYEQPYRQELLEAQTPGGQPVRMIALVLGYPCSTMNVYRVGNRVILGNGFHRLYALRQLGVTHAPAVVQHITQPQLELPPQIAELPRDYLLENPRPALLKDFFDKQLTCEIRQRGFLKAVQVGWGVNDSMVPR